VADTEVAAPMDTCDPTCTSRADSSFESGRSHPRRDGASLRPAANASSAISTCPVGDSPASTARRLVSLTAFAVENHAEERSVLAVERPRRFASSNTGVDGLPANRGECLQQHFTGWRATAVLMRLTRNPHLQGCDPTESASSSTRARRNPSRARDEVQGKWRAF